MTTIIQTLKTFKNLESGDKVAIWFEHPENNQEVVYEEGYINPIQIDGEDYIKLDFENKHSINIPVNNIREINLFYHKVNRYIKDTIISGLNQSKDLFLGGKCICSNGTVQDIQEVIDEVAKW